MGPARQAAHAETIPAYEEVKKGPEIPQTFIFAEGAARIDPSAVTHPRNKQQLIETAEA